MDQYPTNALEFLKCADGLMTAVCAAYYETYLENNPDAEKNLYIFCDNINYLPPEKGTISVKNNVPPEEYRKAYEKNKIIVNQLVENLQVKKESEQQFYKELWEQLKNPALFPTNVDRVAALIQFAEMDQIPYFQLGMEGEMSDEIYQSCTKAIIPQLKKALFAINCGYEQKTQLAEQLIQIASSLSDKDERRVFVAQIVAFYEHKVRKVVEKLEELERAQLKSE